MNNDRCNAIDNGLHAVYSVGDLFGSAVLLVKIKEITALLDGIMEL